MSWNARVASTELPRLFAVYSAGPEDPADLQEGVTRRPDLENVGVGEGVVFQQLRKSCPASPSKRPLSGCASSASTGDRSTATRRKFVRRPTVGQQAQNVIDPTAIISDFPLPGAAGR